MKTFYTYLFMFFLIFSCDQSDSGLDANGDPIHEFPEDQNEQPTDDMGNPQGSIGSLEYNGGETIINHVLVELPEGSLLKKEDLVLSSIITSEAPVKNNLSTVETFYGNTYELIIASDSSGNLMLMSLLNPNKEYFPEINAETTAMTFVMMMPWASDFSTESKGEAIKNLRTLPAFIELKLQIESNISQGFLDLEGDDKLIALLLKIQSDITSKSSKYTISPDPLQFDLDTAGKSIIYNIRSSASYGIGLYDENNQFIVHNVSQGIEKTRFIFNGLTTGHIYDNKNAEFDILSDGDWTFRAKSGLSFDGSLENQQAAYYNIRDLSANVLGIFSGKLKNLLKGSECAVALGEYIYNNVSGSISFAEKLKLYKEEKITGGELSKEIFLNVYDRIDKVISIAEDCRNDNVDSYGIDKIKKIMDRINKIVDIWGRLQSSFNFGAHLADWIQYDKEITLCFNKSNDQIGRCDVFAIEGNLDFGTVSVYSDNLKKINITNISENDIELKRIKDSFGYNGGEPNYGIIGVCEGQGNFPIIIPPGGSTELRFCLKPKLLGDIEGYILFETSDGIFHYEDGDKVEVKGKAIINEVSIPETSSEFIEDTDTASIFIPVTNNSLQAIVSWEFRTIEVSS